VQNKEDTNLFDSDRGPLFIIMPRVLLILFATLAIEAISFATADYHVDAFVCSSRNQPMPRQALSHGQLVRICIQPSTEFSLHGIDSFRFEQSHLSQVAIREGGLLEDTETTGITCKDQLCILESYLNGEFFISGEDFIVRGHGNVNLEQKISFGNFRQVRKEQMQSALYVAIKIKINPLPVLLDVGEEELIPHFQM
jgi:hypothetical protein